MALKRLYLTPYLLVCYQIAVMYMEQQSNWREPKVIAMIFAEFPSGRRLDFETPEALARAVLLKLLDAVRLLVEIRAHPTLAVLVHKGAAAGVESWKVFGTASDCIFSGPMLRDRRSDEHTSHDEAANHRP